jgi:hypothetical protein
MMVVVEAEGWVEMFMTAASESWVPELNVRLPLLSFLGSADFAEVDDGILLVAADAARAILGISSDWSEKRDLSPLSDGAGLGTPAGGGALDLRMDAMRSGIWAIWAGQRGGMVGPCGGRRGRWW